MPSMTSPLKNLLEGIDALSTGEGQEPADDTALPNQQGAPDKEPPENAGDTSAVNTSTAKAPDGDEAPNVEEMRKEIKKLRHELATAHGRLAPFQQSTERFRAANEELTAELEFLRGRVEELERDTSELSTYKQKQSIEDAVAEMVESNPDMDPDYARSLLTAAQKTLAPQPPKPAPTQEKPKQTTTLQNNPTASRIIQLLGDPTRNVGQLQALAHSEPFTAWVSARPEVAALINAFTAASSPEQADELALRIDLLVDEYLSETQAADLESKDTSPPTQQPADVASYVSRTGNKAGLTEAEYQRRRRALQQNLRSRSPEIRRRAQEDLNKLHTQFSSQ